MRHRYIKIGATIAVLGVAFALAFVLAVLSGSGTASSVALITAIGPRAPELGVDPLALGGIIVLAAEAVGATEAFVAVHRGSPVQDVLLRALAERDGGEHHRRGVRDVAVGLASGEGLVQPGVERHHPRLIAGEGAVGKGIDLGKGKLHRHAFNCSISLRGIRSNSPLLLRIITASP